MSSPIDTITETQQKVHELTVTLYITTAVAVVSMIMAIVFYYQKSQYEKDIIMTVKDIADRQHQLDMWNEFNRTHIPETALPRIKEIETLYLKG